MANVQVLPATIAHAEEAKHNITEKAEEITKDEVTSPPPPPPPPSEQKQADPKTDVDLEPEILAVAIEAKAVLADEPLKEKKIVGSSNKVAPEPFVEETEETAKVASEPEPIVKDHEDDEDDKEKPVEEEEKISPQATEEKKEE